jgi:predicted DNA-binding protein
MTTDKKRNVLFLNIPIDERERIRQFSEAIGRPISWVVRDACRTYLDATEKHADALRAPKVTISKAGKTEPRKRGRPKGSRKALVPNSDLNGHRKQRGGEKG